MVRLYVHLHDCRTVCTKLKSGRHGQGRLRVPADLEDPNVPLETLNTLLIKITYQIQTIQASCSGGGSVSLIVHESSLQLQRLHSTQHEHQ